MDVNDSTEFRRRLVTLAELFDLKLSPQRQALYFEAMRDLPFDAVAGALNQAAKACTWFPKPAELRKFACGDSEDQAELAWMTWRKAMASAGSYASLVVEDAALGEAVVAMCGSWPAACALELSPEMWASKRKEFGRVYRVLRDRHLEGSRYLMGICERQNAGRPDWMTFVPVAHIGTGGVLRSLTQEEAEQARTQIGAVSHELSRLDAEMVVAVLPESRDQSA